MKLIKKFAQGSTADGIYVSLPEYSVNTEVVGN